jgi:hypothetical protein
MAAIMGNIGISMSDLGRHKDALSSLMDAVTLAENLKPHYYADYLAHNVIAALNAQEPMLAAGQMLVLARVAPFVNSSRIDSCIGKILAKSVPWASALEMRDARDQLRTVMRLGASNGNRA